MGTVHLNVFVISLAVLLCLLFFLDSPELSLVLPLSFLSSSMLLFVGVVVVVSVVAVVVVVVVVVFGVDVVEVVRGLGIGEMGRVREVVVMVLLALVLDGRDEVVRGSSVLAFSESCSPLGKKGKGC